MFGLRKLCLLILLWLALVLETFCQPNALLTVFEDRCITSTSSAIAPIYNLSDSYWNEVNIVDFPVSKFVFPDNRLVKKLCGGMDSCSKGNNVLKRSSLQLETTNNLITDWRWEYLPTYITKPKQILEVVEFNRPEITITFSVQIQPEAHVLICENNKPPYSNCYYFLLRKDDAVAKICNKIEPKGLYDQQMAPCQITSTNKYSESDGSIFNGDRWDLFKIIITRTYARLENDQHKILISTQNEQSGFSPRHVLFHGKVANGLWKVHNFDCSYTEESNQEIFNIPLVFSGEQCLAIFVAMCSHCYIQVQLLDRGYFLFPATIKYDQFIFSQDENWKEEKLYFERKWGTLYVNIKTIKKRIQTGLKSFWALSNIRTCHNKERRVLQPGKSTNIYQFIENGSIVDMRIDTISSLEHNCNKDEFGENCQKCSIAYAKPTCPARRKYCELLKTITGNLVQKCYCSAGSSGSACAEPTQPWDLKVTWTPESYLNIEWKHPNQTNGLLEKFDIMVNNEKFEYIIKSQADYQMAYKYQVMENLVFPSEYVVEVFARNSAGNSPKAVKPGILSPPPTPHIVVKERKEDNIYELFLGNNIPTNASMKIFLYALITECDDCREALMNFYEQVVSHHRESNREFIGPALNWNSIERCNLTNYRSPSYELDLENYNGNGFKNLAIILVYKHGNYVRSDIKTFTIEWDIKSQGSWTIIIIVVVPILIILACIICIRKKYFARGRTIAGLSVQARHLPLSEEPQYVNTEEIDLSEIEESRLLSPEIICPGHSLFKTKYSQRIKLDNFEKCVKNAIVTGELESQHKLLSKGLVHASNYGQLVENKDKNRYQNLIAYDHSRVVLEKIDGSEHSDYINANYIDGYRQPKAYIATQGPKKNTVVDFWRMIWQENVKYIVMLANIIEGGKKKSEQYWPDINQKATFGKYTVEYISSVVYANYEYRQFKLKYLNSTKLVSQLHFTAWPDHGVPLYPQSLVPFLQKMLQLRSNDFPLVVHCSAGVGRTGTIILCDICLRMAASEGYVDVLSMLEHLRNARPSMVDNITQYTLVHLVVINCMFGIQSNIPINQHFSKAVQEMCAKIDNQLDHIKNCEWQEDCMKRSFYLEGGEPLIVPEKNRFADIIPDRAAKIFLSPHGENSPRDSTYINAIRVDGFCQPGRFIVTQFPLPNTVNDFWRLVVERSISVIVCLNEIPINDEKFGLFFPKDQNSLLTDICRVSLCKTKSYPIYDIMTFEILLSKETHKNKRSIVDIVQYHGWSYPEVLPEQAKFLEFVEDATRIAAKSNPLLVTCYDGTTGCGLFIAMSFLIEKIKWEQECDVCQAVKSIRTSRKQFISTKEQMEFLYSSSVFYVETRFDQYSNIK